MPFGFPIKSHPIQTKFHKNAGIAINCFLTTVEVFDATFIYVNEEKLRIFTIANRFGTESKPFLLDKCLTECNVLSLALFPFSSEITKQFSFILNSYSKYLSKLRKKLMMSSGVVAGGGGEGQCASPHDNFFSGAKIRNCQCEILYNSKW